MFKPKLGDELSLALYKMQQIVLLEEASERSVSKTEKNGQQNVSRCNVEGNYSHP